MQKLAFVFPGQGSQSVGMMAAYGDDAEIRAAFDEASLALGEDLWAMAADGPAERLSLTTNTQPLMLTAGVAVFRSWVKRTGRAPDVVAGHSLGEYAALVAAGVLRLKDAVPLVRLRAQAMQDAVPAGTGAMAAVLGLGAAAVQACCDEEGPKQLENERRLCPKGIESPKYGKTGPQQTEGDDQRVGWKNDDTLTRLSRPQQPFATLKRKLDGDRGHARWIE